MASGIGPSTGTSGRAWGGPPKEGANITGAAPCATLPTPRRPDPVPRAAALSPQGERVRAQALASQGQGCVSSPLASLALRPRNARSPAVPQTQPTTRFARYAWGVLAWNVG